MALMCAPHKCPGNCSYCPRGENAPQSYTGKEPAAMRAINNNYDAFRQIKDRIKQYEDLGHRPEKIELIIMGGTFLSCDKAYKESFISDCYKALNFNKKPSRNYSLSFLQGMNEKAHYKCVAMVFETRPDYAKEEHINEMLRFGGTRCELGVQSIYDDVLAGVNRGCGVSEVIDATKRLKDAGFKVDYHIMLGLPGSSKERDSAMLNELFKNPLFQPDGLKIYPTLVVSGSKLYDDYKNGSYTPIDEDYVIDVLSDFKRSVPPYVRIKRIMRDIPATVIAAGPKKSNLREIVWKEINFSCKCIRCREVGRNKKALLHTPIYKTLKYEASGASEFFISCEDENALFGFCRLRIMPHKNYSFIRELHVFGRQARLGERGEWQHKGIGKELLNIAERISKENGCDLVKIISGAGVRDYYRKQGYSLTGYYMTKTLNNSC